MLRLGGRVRKFGLVVALLGLCACGGGSSNPFGSFGSIGSGPSFGSGAGSRADPVDAALTSAGSGAVNDGTILVPSIAAARPEPGLRGLIIRASAVAPVQGYYLPALRPLNRGRPDENGVVTLEFRAYPPVQPGPAGPTRSRALEAAAFFSDADLASISGFLIVSETNKVSLVR